MCSRIDIFCDVVDNFGDAGVTYRLAKALKRELPESLIRLYTNGLEAFSAIDRSIDPALEEQSAEGIDFISYGALTEEFVQKCVIPELVIEAFACHIPEIYYNKALDSDCLIINLDHLSAEHWIEGVHLKPSLIGKKAKKYFFMPGFTETSGGLILDTELSDERIKDKRKYFEGLFGFIGKDKLITVFTYEHDFSQFLSDLEASGISAGIVVFGEKSRKSIEKIQSDERNIKIAYADFLPQDEYGYLLKVSDLNFVRGEDSWARACLSGRPFVWHSYYQEDNYQQVKVRAFLEMYGKYFQDKDLFGMYSDYLLKFNDRSEAVKDPDCAFLLQNLETLGSYNRKMSSGLIKDCNLIKNILFFARSLNIDKKST